VVCITWKNLALKNCGPYKISQFTVKIKINYGTYNDLEQRSINQCQQLASFKNKKSELMSQDARKPIAVPVCKLSVYLQPFRHSSFLSVRCSRKIAKINKSPFFESSRFFKVIDVDTTEKLVTSACCDR